MTRARNISNPQSVALPLTVSANITSNAIILVGNVSINTVSYSVGNSTVNTTIHATSISTNGTLSVGNTTITGTLTATANVNLDSGTLFVDGTNNRVGINNAAPTQALTVTGDSFVNGVVTFANSTSNTFTSYANGNLSVGTPASSYRLEVQSNTGAVGIRARTTSNGSSAVFVAAAPTNAGDLGMRIELSDSLKWLIGMPNNVADNNFSIFNASTNSDALTIGANGSIGIGTSDIFSPIVIKSDWRSGFGQISLVANTAGATVGHSYHNSSGTRVAYCSVDTNLNGSFSIGPSAAGNLYFVTSDTVRGYFANNGNLFTNNNYYPRSASAYAAVTDLGWTAPIQVQETSTGTTSYRYIPMISGTSVSSSGYRQHTVFGSARGSAWGDAFIAVGGNDSYPTVAFTFSYGGVFTAPSTKNFKIDHPLPSKANTHFLIHAAVEAPQADLIYRGKVDLVNGQATVNIDTAARMTEGTFDVLCRNIQVFTTNETDWVHVRGTVSGNILTIESETPTNATISWMIVAERDDENVYKSYPIDGRLVVEPPKEEPIPAANTAQ